MFLINKDEEEWDVTTKGRGHNLINTCYFEKDTLRSGEEKIGPDQTSLI